MHHDTGFLCDQVELPVFQQRKGRLSKRRSLWRLTVRQIPAPHIEPWAHTVTARQPHKIPKTCCPSLDLLTEAQRKWLNRWLPRNVKFYRCYAACLLSSSCPLLQNFNSITAVELFNYAEQMFLSENDALHWHLTISTDTMLDVVVFLYLYRVEADLLSPQFSPPFRVIAEARGGGWVRNNLLALHSYFQHRDGAMNSDMDVALLQRLWFFAAIVSIHPLWEDIFVMRCEAYSI